MDNFKAVYRILNFLKKSEQFDEFDDENFTAGHFELNSRQWALVLERMIDEGIIKGVSVRWGACAEVSWVHPRITMKGLIYLAEIHEYRLPGKSGSE